MLLEFRAKNYRSFKDEFVFSLIPDTGKKDLEYSILHKNINGKQYKALCSSIVYGPNAAGKSNIIEAMDTLKAIIIRGHISSNKSLNKRTSNIASDNLELIPNNQERERKPVSFGIKFIVDNVVINYELDINLGRFLEESHIHRVLKEALYINDDLIFLRSEMKLNLGNDALLTKYNQLIIEKNINIGRLIASSTLKYDDLFLTNGFKNIFAPRLVELLLNWFNNNFFIIYHSENYKSMIGPVDNEAKAFIMPDDINKLVNSIGLNSNSIAYIRRDENSEPELCSIFNKVAISAEAIESCGTIRLINMLMPLIHTFQQGAALIVDEFDCSFHPMIVMNIINLFHNPDINRNNAQLIFNTHNPIFLNNELFRRDEIKFVDREYDQFSELYSLSDFPTSGKGSVRNSSNFMKNYFISKYGAIKDIDFAPIFEEILKKTGYKLKNTVYTR